MSFSRLPDRIAGYATYELAEMMTRLTARQRAAIDRIVQHIYIENRPWAELFRGDDKIVSETNYYRRPKVDAETGEIAHKGGWGHDPTFQAALKTAARLALQAQERERLQWLQQAKRKAEENAEHAVDTWIRNMTEANFASEQNTAAKHVVDLAFRGHDQAHGEQQAGDEEADWWAAAEDGDEPD